MPETLLTVEQAAERLQLHPESARRLAQLDALEQLFEEQNTQADASDQPMPPHQPHDFAKIVEQTYHERELNQ